jgi:TetR/AcrR family transcriptional regulator, mexJK operon transcriptional repressor
MRGSEYMEHQLNKRTQRTREQLRSAAHRQFLKLGYQATSIDSLLAEAGISSTETFYRHYASKEALFVDVLSHLTMEQPNFSEKLAALPRPHDLPSLRQAFTHLSREILSMICQPGYLPLVRMIIADMPRFPQLGTLFFSTVTARGLALVTALLREAHEYHIIADLDFDTVAQMWLGGLLTSVMASLVTGEDAHLPSLDRADAVVEILMRALTPETENKRS